MVVKDNKYVNLLRKTMSVNIENDISTISEMQKANRILTERLKAKNENTYKLVKEDNGVSQMQKKVVNITEDGKVNERVITQTFIDVTSRKRKSNEAI